MWLNDDVRFCFTAYEDNEQLEGGDTLIHTFFKPAWPFSTTKWLYFWGEVNSEVSVSTSPIFKHQNTTGAPPLPVLSRFAWARNFSWLGSLRNQVAGTGLATTFQVPTPPVWPYQFHLFSKNKEDVSVRIGIKAVDGDNKPTGPYLSYVTYNLLAGVEDGGDGGANPVYRHTITLPWVFESAGNYALISLTLTGTANWWVDFRRAGWIGAKDDGTANHVTEHRTLDAGLSWIYAHPGHQCYESWGYQF